MNSANPHSFPPPKSDTVFGTSLNEPHTSNTNATPHMLYVWWYVRLTEFIIPLYSALRDLVSARGQLSNGRGQMMHEPKASALSARGHYLIVRAH